MTAEEKDNKEYAERISEAICRGLAELSLDNIIPPGPKAMIRNLIAQNPCDRCMDKDDMIFKWMQTCGEQTDEIAKLKERVRELEKLNR